MKTGLDYGNDESGCLIGLGPLSLSSYFRAYVIGFDIPLMQEVIGEALAKINDTDIEAHPVNILGKSLGEIPGKEGGGEVDVCSTGTVINTRTSSFSPASEQGDKETGQREETAAEGGKEKEEEEANKNAGGMASYLLGSELLSQLL